MATAKKTSTVASKKAVGTAVPAVKTAASAVKPIKESFAKAGLAVHLAEQSAVDPKTVKAVLAALEATILGSVHKKGAGEFALLGLVHGVNQGVRSNDIHLGRSDGDGCRWSVSHGRGSSGWLSLSPDD